MNGTNGSAAHFGGEGNTPIDAFAEDPIGWDRPEALSDEPPMRPSEPWTWHNADAVAESLGIRQDDRAVTTLPGHNCYGLSVVHSHLLAGASLFLPKPITMEKLWAEIDFGWLDRVISFCIDLFLSFPFILGALALAPIVVSRFSTDLEALARAQVLALVAVLVVFGWMGLARLIRGQVLSLREREFVQAAHVLGLPTRHILFKELLPNLVAPIVVAVSLSLPAYVAAEAGLSYLGIGLTGVPSLGQTINDAVPSFEQYPLYLWAPVVTVMVLVLALNLLGDAIRDAFDPRTRR